MAARLLRTQLSMVNCQQHLDSTGTWGSEIESYLTEHILIVMCAEVQQSFYSVLESRLNESADIELKNFALKAGKRVLRSVAQGEVAGFVGLFGSDAKDYLNKNIDEREMTLYGNAISGRHDIAHSFGSNITFRELSEIVLAAESFIDIVERAISSSR